MSNMLRLCEVCKELKLELGSLHLLIALAEWPLAGGRSMSDLARQVGVTVPNIRYLAYSLEARGLMVTKHTLYNNRKVYCSLTQAGEDVVEQIRLAATMNDE